MFKKIKTLWKLANMVDSPNDVEKIKRVSSRSGTVPTDEDRERAEEAKRNRAELRKYEFELQKQELEIEKMQKLQDLEIRREELKALKEELQANRENGGGGMEDLLMQKFMEKILSGETQQTQPRQAPATNYYQDAATATQPEAEQVQTRFKDEDLKAQLPKLLNPEQLKALKNLNLNDDETIQFMDCIKSL